MSDNLSRVEDILQSKIDGTAYNKPPLSRVEELLLELDTGGGGGTTDYNQLSNKPTLNGKEISGELTSEDLDLEGNMDMTYDPSDETVVISQDFLKSLLGN